MKKSSDKRLVPSNDALASAVGEETVILHLKKGAYFGLDAVGTRVWELLNQGYERDAICAQLGCEYEVAPDVLEADVALLLEELVANQIIHEAGSPVD